MIELKAELKQNLKLLKLQLEVFEKAVDVIVKEQEKLETECLSKDDLKALSLVDGYLRCVDTNAFTLKELLTDEFGI